MMKGAWAPLSTTNAIKSPHKGGSGGIKATLQTPFLNPEPFPVMVWDRKCS